MDKYKLVKKLGDGSFGVVYKAINTQTNETVAIKKFKQKYKSWDDCIELREVKSLRKLNHRNIIKLKQVLQVSDEFYMVFEYLEYNLLELYAKSKENNKRLTESEIRSIVHQVASGLAYMHKNGFFHRDMKPENLLVYNNVVKLCDFGLAREIRSRPPFTQYVSTRWYRAPELLLRSTSYNSPVDIFALGCIMAQLYTQVPLFPGSNEVDQLNRIVKVLGTPTKQQWPQGYKLAGSRNFYFPQQKGQDLQDMIPMASPQAIDLIEQMLQYQSRKRPTALEILKHPYFQGFVPLSQEQTKPIEPIMHIAADSKPLDTKKHDQIFRNTKERFRSTKERFMTQKPKEQSHDDLDDILKELEQKHKRDNKLPFINTKEGFNKQKHEQNRIQKPEPPAKYESQKPSIHPPQHSSYRNQPRNFTKFEKKDDEVIVKLPGLKNQKQLPKILSYGFQPQLNNVQGLQPLPPSKYGRPLLGQNLNNPGGLTPVIRHNLFKQRDILGQPLKARSQVHNGVLGKI